MTPRLRDELIRLRLLEGTNDVLFRSRSAAAKDQIWTTTAAHVIKTRRPSFMLIHMLVCDSTQHKYGPQSPAVYTALAFADAQLGEVLRAIDAAGLRQQTTLLVTADHGFEVALKISNPNVAFRKAGLLEVGSTPGIIRTRAQIVSEGGIAMVYLTDAATFGDDIAKVKGLMYRHEGIAEIITADRFPSLRMPDPRTNRQIADLTLVAEPGYAFNNEARGEEAIAQADSGRRRLPHQ